MATTPVYGWPYQALSDAPNGALLGQNGFLAAEATVQARQTEIIAAQVAIVAIQAVLPYRDRQTLAAPAASVTFSGIPAALRSLTVNYRGRSNSGTAGNVSMTINGSAAAVYSYYACGSSNAADITPAGSNGDPSSFVGVIPGSGTRFSAGEVVIPGWDVTTSLQWQFHTFAYDGVDLYARYGGGVYNAAGPYTSLTLTPAAGSWVAGSDFQIVGDRT